MVMFLRDQEVTTIKIEFNVKAFIKVIKFGPFLKNDKICDSLKSTYKKVKKNRNVNKNLKNQLYNVLLKKGCRKR